ncbi:MAG: methyltransferase domain-containing protein, partial [Actinomycetota bacterium]
AVALRPGDRRLDLACGTGIVARTAHGAGEGVEVAGVDLNRAMLTVARRIEPAIEWIEGDVGRLPVDDDSYDAATCQMAFMFFPDRSAALAEMARVVRPSGRLAVLVPAAIEAQAAYGPFVDVVVRRTGEAARSMLSTYWNCGDIGAFAALATGAGWKHVAATTPVGVAHFGSIEAFVDTELDATPLGDRIEDDDRTAIVDELRPVLSQWLTDDGLTIPFACNLVAGAA